MPKPNITIVNPLDLILDDRMTGVLLPVTVIVVDLGHGAQICYAPFWNICKDLGDKKLFHVSGPELDIEVGASVTIDHWRDKQKNV